MWHEWGGMGFGPILMIVVPILLILFFVWLVRLLTFDGVNQDRKPNAREILDQRFARGEIDEEEYHRRRKAIDS